MDWHSPKTSFVDIVNAYQGSKKRTYIRALENLKHQGFEKKMAIVKMFIKPDRIPEAAIKDKAPRAIQYRSAEFNLLMAHHLKQFEHDFYDKFKPFGLRVVAKGLNPRQRASLLIEKLQRFNKPYILNIDHSKFDSTVNMHHLKETHKIYKKAVGKDCYHLLKNQLKNRCYSKNGIKYMAEATRMSGDYDTGLGNTLINCACLMKVFEGIKFDFILDGDDAVVICEQMVDMRRFELFGFETKATYVDAHGIEFCQSKLIWNNGWMFSRNPLRAISNQTVARKNFGPKGFKRYLAGVGMCELSVSSGVPILQRHAVRLKELHHKPLYDQRMLYRMDNGLEAVEIEIPRATRLSFYLAWGIEPDLQVAMENTPEHPLKAAYSGYTESETLEDVAKSLYESWASMGSMGCTCGPIWQ